MAAFALNFPYVDSKFSINPRATSAQNMLLEDRITRDSFTVFDDSSYKVTTPIPLEIERANYGYVASFRAANLSVAGDTKADARQALEIEILDAFDDWTSDESMLGPGPKQQLAVLKRHIVKLP